MENEPSVKVEHVDYLHLYYGAQRMTLPADEAKDLAVRILQSISPESVEQGK